MRDHGEREGVVGGGGAPMIAENPGVPRRRSLRQLALSGQDRSFMLLDVLALILAERMTRFAWGGLDGLLLFRPESVWLPLLNFLLFYCHDLYAYSRYVRVFLSSWGIFRALAISFVLREAINGIFLDAREGVWLRLSLYAVTFAVVLLGRLLVKKFILNGRLKCQVVILGSEAAGSGLSSALSEENRRNLEVVAEIPQSEAPGRAAGRIREILESVPGVQFVVREGASLERREAARLLKACMEHRVACVETGDFISAMEGRLPLASVSGSGKFSALKSRRRMLSRRQWMLKRGLDLAFSAAVLALFAPFGLLIALLIKLTSEGPVFYSQLRVTRYGRLFTVYKFRTMGVNSEPPPGTMSTKAGDPRIYPFGRMLRRYHLDEFPQFWNVIKGDMSLVGPRAEYVESLKTAKDHYPEFEYRELVPSGITGWAQIHQGHVDQIEDYRVKLEYDLYYILNYSFSLDIQVIFLTALAFLRPRGDGV